MGDDSCMLQRRVRHNPSQLIEYDGLEFLPPELQHQRIDVVVPRHLPVLEGLRAIFGAKPLDEVLGGKCVARQNPNF